MPNKDPKTDTADSTENIDLNALADLNFGPSWADASLKSNKLDSLINTIKKNQRICALIVNALRKIEERAFQLLNSIRLPTQQIGSRIHD